MNDFEGVSDDTDGFDFFACVSSVELHGANESFDDGAESLSELFGLISACGVRDKDLCFGGLGCDIVDEAGIFNLNEVGVTLMSS
jgi:hypothetical protein